MDTFRTLLPSNLSPGSLTVLGVCLVAVTGVLVSVVHSWLRQRREEYRIRHGD